MEEREKTMGPATRAIHAGHENDPLTGALRTPLYQATAFAFPDVETGAAAFEGTSDHYRYTRLGNPTLAALERRMAALEEGESAVATASGMAAVASAVLPLLHQGDHMVVVDSVYSGTYDLFTVKLAKLGIETTIVDGTSISSIESAIRDNTKVLYVETPGNPTLALVDIEAAARVAKARGIISIIDNTFASPCGQRPIKLGVDVVVHSATKYLCGHGDAIGGVIVGTGDFIRRVRKEALEDFGGIMSPFAAWLILRGIETLPLRFKQHCANALAVAQFLEGDAQVEWVAYPGLASHPQHELARRQMQQFGGMVCFELKGGVEAGRQMLNALRLCSLAVSLGDTRTLITHPASMTHAKVQREARLKAGITDGLVRLSVGLEDVEDIIADLGQALAKVKV
jgi:methionine-gamma-lyase